MKTAFAFRRIMSHYMLCVTILTFTACVGAGNKEDTNVGKQAYEIDRNPVDTIMLRRTAFKSQLISNGKLRAATKSVLRFPGTGVVTELRVKNNDRVAAGDVIARLDSRDERLRLEKAKSLLSKAEILLEDALLEFGYTASKRDNIPDETLRIARIRSGYDDALLEEQASENALTNCVLTAPVSGKIANLTTHLHEYPTGNEFCTILDDSAFEVNFPILETELGQVRTGQEILVSTFVDPDKRYNGRITEINPLVDDKGQIGVKAQFRNPGGFIDGMNVKVYIENGVPGKLVVPKNAVLIRDNLEVLFCYNDGRAAWTYVHVLMTNSTSCVVVANEDRGASLKEGDAVIITGNINLTDGSQVEIKR